MAVPTRSECLYRAAAHLERASEIQNPEWSKANAMVASAYIELAKIQTEEPNG